MGIGSETCIMRRYHCCVNVIECTFLSLDGTADDTAGLRVQPVAPGCKAVLHGAGLHTAGNCNTMLSTGYRNLSKHRKGTVKYNTKEKKWPTYLGNLP